MITIRLQSGPLTALLNQLSGLAGHPRPMVMAATGAARKTLQAHFKLRQQQPNKLGGKRTNFWQDVYRSTQIGQVTDQHGIVVIGDHRFGQKVFGGVIHAGKGASGKTGARTKLLAIPVAPEAHGRRPATLETEKGIKLFMIPRSGGGGLLAAAAKAGKKQPGSIKIYYVLRASVTQAPDPQALPQSGLVEADAVAAAESYLRTLIPRSPPSP